MTVKLFRKVGYVAFSVFMVISLKSKMMAVSYFVNT